MNSRLRYGQDAFSCAAADWRLGPGSRSVTEAQAPEPFSCLFAIQRVRSGASSFAGTRAAALVAQRDWILGADVRIAEFADSRVSGYLGAICVRSDQLRTSIVRHTSSLVTPCRHAVTSTRGPCKWDNAPWPWQILQLTPGRQGLRWFQFRTMQTASTSLTSKTYSTKDWPT